MQSKYRISNLISIYLAAGILLLHTFIPHTHAEEHSEYSQLSCDQEGRCIMDFLGGILEHNFGEDHLERFQISKNQFDDINIDFFHELTSIQDDLRIKLPTVKLPEYLDQVPDDPNLNLCQYRGPPFYS